MGLDPDSVTGMSRSRDKSVRVKTLHEILGWFKLLLGDTLSVLLGHVPRWFAPSTWKSVKGRVYY